MSITLSVSDQAVKLSFVVDGQTPGSPRFENFIESSRKTFTMQKGPVTQSGALRTNGQRNSFSYPPRGGTAPAIIPESSQPRQPICCSPGVECLFFEEPPRYGASTAGKSSGDTPTLLKPSPWIACQLSSTLSTASLPPPPPILVLLSATARDDTLLRRNLQTQPLSLMPPHSAWRNCLSFEGIKLHYSVLANFTACAASFLQKQIRCLAIRDNPCLGDLFIAIRMVAACVPYYLRLIWNKIWKRGGKNFEVIKRIC